MYLLVLVANGRRMRKICWRSNERVNVDVNIKFEDFLGEIHRISEINSVEYDLVLRCLYNMNHFIYAFVISNQEDLHFFLINNDV